MLVACALPVVVPVSWLLAGALQPRHYSPVRQTVSQLAGLAATDRWIVTSALYGVGLLYLVSACWLPALGTIARAGLVLAGVAALGVGIFPEPVHGESSVHAGFAALGALTLASWPMITACQPNILAAIGLWPSMLAVVVSAGLFVFAVIEARGGNALGLAERLTGLQTCWPTVVAIALHRKGDR